MEVDVHVNAEETHGESDKGNVGQVVPNDASTDTANDTTQEVGAVLTTVTVETPQEAVEVREVLEQGDRVGPTEVELIVTIVEKFTDKYFDEKHLAPFRSDVTAI